MLTTLTTKGIICFKALVIRDKENTKVFILYRKIFLFAKVLLH